MVPQWPGATDIKFKNTGPLTVQTFQAGMKQQRTYWIVFALIFLATQDYVWIGQWPDRLYLGLPVWLYYFILVHIAFIVAIYRYSKSRTHDPAA